MILLLALAGHAMACPACSAQTLCVLPGFALIGAHVGLVLPILGGFLERPFFTLAGARVRGLGFSIQANLLSTLVIGVAGGFVLGAAWRGGDGLLLMWFPFAVVLAFLLEWLWLAKPWRRPRRRLKWGWLLLGNILSAIVIAILPLLSEISRSSPYLRVTGLHRTRDTVALLTLIACIIVYVIAFISTRGILVGDPADDEPRGFEVIPVGQGEPSTNARE